jgi:hypothetical protein
MRNENFDKEAMERKIRNNIERGFTLEGILLALKEELKTNLEIIAIREARSAELSDQIEYLEEKYYAKPKGGQNRT